MKVKQRLLVSVSGGRSSALMAYFIWLRYKDQYEIVFVFANTSREKEETLLFVHQLTLYFGIPIIWVEAVVHHGKRKGCTHKVVTYETATRNGSIFEEVIKKYGIPNQAFLHCTRELKTNPIRSYIRSLGWKDFTKYTTAIGYRKDEPKRANLLKAEELHQWYPLYDWCIKKSDVAVFWLKQKFDLKLADYDGNCELCHKKSDRKIITQVVTNSKSADWIYDMETKYQYHTAGRIGVPPPYRFFRHNRLLDEVMLDYHTDFKLAEDKSLNTKDADYDFELDEQSDCSESCEPF